MKDHHVPQEHLSAFARRLAEEERSAGTVEKYLRDAGAFLEWLAGAPVSREAVTGWKAHLVRSGYRPATINSMLAALNTFLRFIGLEDCRVRALRVQRRLFQSEERELSRQEYQRLLDTARTLGRDRLALVMETICAAGIRVSEVRYITVEAARSGQADIALKGKVRTILLPGKLCRKLLKYAETAKNRFRRDLPHQKRQSSVQAADLGGDEAPVPPGRGGPHQGLPSQPAPSLCAHLLSGHPGRGQAGRCPGALQH